jgi:CheY-like chemotaxis protein
VLLYVSVNIKGVLMGHIDPRDILTYHSARIQSFQKLMPHKIRDILLVSSLYDNYLFEEDGRLYDLIREESHTLNLSYPPEITHVTGGEEALELASIDSFDLIITTLHIEDMHVIRFAQMVREAGLNMPIILLAYDNREKKDIVANFDTSIFERIFIWQGDFRLLIAIIKSVEDKLNVDHDTQVVGVQSIILVEDNVKFYSSYLPIIYTEILNQSQRLVLEGVNLTHKLLRLRARPKILLCINYEEAWAYFEKYQDTVLGVISDINFMRNGVKDPEGGLNFARAVREQHGDIPILLQSSNTEFAPRAKDLGIAFVRKGSPRLLHEVREFILNNLGFGDFVFRTRDGREVGRATNLMELERQLEVVPDESILFHAGNNHFSNWLKARTEFSLAHSLRPRKVSDFASVEDLRAVLINSLRDYQELQQRGVISEFSRSTFDPANSFARIGSGSLGGKARGLGFTNQLISAYNLREKFPGIEIFVPSAVVLATDVFDRFLWDNRLESFALSAPSDDQELIRRFLEATQFPTDILHRLSEYLDLIREPLAVRSSSLLEDSQYQPFAGVYETYMIANNDPNPDERLRQLLRCIKLVYASTYTRSAREYMKATSYRLEEEKMAVIIQRMVGSHRNGRFYPDFSGVAKSYNFYPISPQKSTDGIVQAAFGLGKTVVEGGNSVRFCPRYPRHLLQFSSTQETMRSAQQEFYALNMADSLTLKSELSPELLLQRFPIDAAEGDQALSPVASTYSPENDSVHDGIARPGKRVVTFAPILKHKVFPLPEILDLMLDVGSSGMGTAVEIEWAVNLNVPSAKLKEFALLQMRPLVFSTEFEELDVENIRREDIICQSTQVLGNGTIGGIHDVVVVDIHTFDRAQSSEVGAEVSLLNSRLVAARRPYLLVGVGRWGSLDPWLGIPVTWDQIAGAAVIVESGFKDFHVTPSQGSHFFQNITSFRVGYFTVNEPEGIGFIDWEWLRTQPAVEAMQFVRHLQFDDPIEAKINGQRNRGVIQKPQVSAVKQPS